MEKTWEVHHITSGKAERNMHEYEFTARAEFTRRKSDRHCAECTLIRWNSETTYSVIETHF